MKTEIISIGSEITSGQNLDTNSQWLSQQLATMGISVHFHTTIADQLDDMVQAFTVASARARLILITGGLGPTLDDLTREALGAAFQLPLVEDAGACAHIQQMFAQRGRPMPDRNRVQALFPSGAEPIFNAVGTAPGIRLVVGDRILIAMPGVPAEMYLMFQNEVKPHLIQSGLGGQILIHKKINIFGLGESAIEEKVADLTRRDHVPEVGITVHDAVISLRIQARAPTIEEARQVIAPIEQTIRDRLGELVFGVDAEELQDVVMQLLKQQKKTVATAESITAGLVAQRLAQVPGASEVLQGGIVAYTREMKQRLLGLEPQLLERYGTVHPEIARQMAIKCREQCCADFAVSTTGLAGPGTGGVEKPIGTVYIGLAWSGGASCLEYSWFGSRQEIQSRTARLALNVLRLKLLNEPSSSL